MVGLQLLKRTLNLSDEQVVAGWVENPYWQYFCGKKVFCHELPIDASLMTQFRRRIGPAGCEFILGLTVQAGLKTGTVAHASLAVVNVDTTVQEKAIAFPTDTRLLHKARDALVRMAKKHGVRLRQSYERIGKAACVRAQRYAHARQMQRARAQVRKLRGYLGRVIRDFERQIGVHVPSAPSTSSTSSVSNPSSTPNPSNPNKTHKANQRLTRLLAVVKRIYSQPRKRAPDDPPKVYSVHAPEVDCIAKGKAHKPYEFGVKVSVISTSKESFVIGMQSLPDNPYDGHTLTSCIQQAQRITGKPIREAYTDRGYRGHGCKLPNLKIWLADAKRGVTRAIARKIKRRNAVEPTIGHMKSDGSLGRSFLKGVEGDAINALLCGAGHNLRKILRKLALLCACFGLPFQALLQFLRAHCPTPMTQPA